jgi:ferredoxin
MAEHEPISPTELDASARNVQSPARSPSQSDGAETQLHVRVDQDHCTGDGLCVQYAPDIFEFDVDGLAYVKDDDGELMTAPGATTAVPASLRLAVIDSADECPGDCIHVTDTNGVAVAGPAS